MVRNYVKEYAAADIRRIADMGSDAPGLRALVIFALVSIRRQFPLVAGVARDAAAGYRADLLGMVRNGLDYIEKRGAELHARVSVCESADYVIDELLSVPGLGLAKAGFVAQMLGFETGCLDTHNARLYGIPARLIRIEKGATARTRLAKIAAYNELCRGLGGSTALWGAWCELVAAAYPETFESGRECSTYHMRTISSLIPAPF